CARDGGATYEDEYGYYTYGLDSW
nr:immunoglobulin heavy chain junction region [Macaca mulatta]MOY19259.1 immunoglobulin heavy chain junction region [Macaca mulatta]MOY19385.1 immunoglobulin heavy chain junction region [Macaca mulatta]MOY19565.1 immunoglobulin heavy chain junction region [Macaca mulatta]MOY20088.1 immunoglobulin heavy chain junction region [Macaca mulatta]